MSEWKFETSELKPNIEKIAKYLHRQNSYRHRFLMGIVNGLGVAIGATFVAGVLFAIATKTIDRVEDIPLVGDWVEDARLKDVVENNSPK